MSFDEVWQSMCLIKHADMAWQILSLNFYETCTNIIFLHNDRHQENPVGTIDETFTSSIHLLGTNDRYNLLLYDQQMNETPSEFQPDQEMCEMYSEFEDSRTV